MATKNKSRFVSRYAQLRVVVQPEWTEVQNGRRVTHKGLAAQFNDGILETDDADIIKFLKESDMNGSTFVEADTDAIAARDEFAQTLEEREAELNAREALLNRRESSLSRAFPEVKTHQGVAGSEKTLLNVDVEEVKRGEADPSVNPDAPAFGNQPSRGSSRKAAAPRKRAAAKKAARPASGAE